MLYSRTVSVAAAGLEGASYEEAVEAAKNFRDSDSWMTITGSSELVSDQRHLATAVLYAASAAITGKMVSRYPEIELLLYLFGTRNIGEALDEARRRGEKVGAVAVSIGGDAEAVLRRVAGRLGARLTAPEIGGWMEAYRRYLAALYPDFPGQLSAETILKLLRARAALVRLSV